MIRSGCTGTTTPSSQINLLVAMVKNVPGYPLSFHSLALALAQIRQPAAGNGKRWDASRFSSFSRGGVARSLSAIASTAGAVDRRAHPRRGNGAGSRTTGPFSNTGDAWRDQASRARYLRETPKRSKIRTHASGPSSAAISTDAPWLDRWLQPIILSTPIILLPSNLVRQSNRP